MERNDSLIAKTISSILTSSPRPVSRSWQPSYISKMTHKQGKLDQTDPRLLLFVIRVYQ